MRPVPRLCSLAVAILFGAAAPSWAQSSVQIYGLLDVSAGQFQNAGGLKVKRLDSGNFSTSHIGFRGTEDLGGGLRAGFTLESFLRMDTGAAGRADVDVFWARNANVNLAGSFGNIRLGRMGPPMWISTLQFNAFGDSFGFSPSVRQYYSLPAGTPVVGDSGWNNAIAYSTPALGGLSATVMVAAGDGTVNSRGKNLGANVTYRAGPLGVTAAWQDVKSQGVLGRPISAFPGFSGQTAYQVGGSYDLKVVRFFVQYGKISTDATLDVDTTNVHLGASVPLGKGALLAAYGTSDVDLQGPTPERTSKIMTLGYDYAMSKRTNVYAIYLSDKFTGLSDGTTYAVGMRHRF